MIKSHAQIFPKSPRDIPREVGMSGWKLWIILIKKGQNYEGFMSKKIDFGEVKMTKNHPQILPQIIPRHPQIQCQIIPEIILKSSGNHHQIYSPRNGLQKHFFLPPWKFEKSLLARPGGGKRCQNYDFSMFWEARGFLFLMSFF